MLDVDPSCDVVSGETAGIMDTPMHVGDCLLHFRCRGLSGTAQALGEVVRPDAEIVAALDCQNVVKIVHHSSVF